MRCFKTIMGISIMMMVCIGNLSGQAGTVIPSYDKAAVLRNNPKNPGEFYAKHFNYPSSAVIDGIEGAVELIVGVNQMGVVESVEIERSLTPEIDSQVREIAMTKGKWKPAKNDGNAISSLQRIVVNIFMTPSQKEFANIMRPFRESGKQPLYVIDGKLVNDYIELYKHQIKSIRVIKGEQAKALYGEIGKDGVVQVQTKRGTPPIF